MWEISDRISARTDKVSVLWIEDVGKFRPLTVEDVYKIRYGRKSLYKGVNG